MLESLAITQRFSDYKMANSKTYLNVSYAEKDAVKLLGGRWDASKKKWYIPANIDVEPFAKWQPGLAGLQAISATDVKAKVKKSISNAVTYPEDIDFVAYSGEQPPWD